MHTMIIVYSSFDDATCFGSKQDHLLISGCGVPAPCQPPSPPLDNIQVMVIVWRLRGNIIRTAPCWVVCRDCNPGLFFQFRDWKMPIPGFNPAIESLILN